MASQFQVYFDGHCSACVEQVEKLRKADRRRKRLTFIDCAGEDFHDDAAERDGLTQAALLRAIHVRSNDGAWYRGAEAIARIYESQEKKRAARFWRSPLAHIAYRCLVVLRPLLNRIGRGQLAASLLRRQAKRLNQDENEHTG